jgi:hypothetical protein
MESISLIIEPAIFDLAVRPKHLNQQTGMKNAMIFVELLENNLNVVLYLFKWDISNRYLNRESERKKMQ